MMTFKQLEAVYWVVQLGGFSQAAQKLRTTQSAVSKRVQELEALFGIPLFDRSQRSARLTGKGEEMFGLAKKLLAQRDAAIEQFVGPEILERRVRIGVTEITAMTWLPRLVSALQAHFPRVVVEPDVDVAAALHEKLVSDQLDLVIVPDVFDEDRRLARKRVGKVELAWMCKPGMVQARRPLRAHELGAYRLLLQGDRSGTGLYYDKWLKRIGSTPSNTLVSNSLIAMIGLAVSGLGITYLPRACLGPMIEAGALELVKVTPLLPEVSYVALHKGRQDSTLLSSIVDHARRACDFTRLYQVDTQQVDAPPAPARTRRRP